MKKQKNKKETEGGSEGGGGRFIESRKILSNATSTQIPYHKTNKKTT